MHLPVNLSRKVRYLLSRKLDDSVFSLVRNFCETLAVALTGYVAAE